MPPVPPADPPAIPSNGDGAGVSIVSGRPLFGRTFGKLAESLGRSFRTSSPPGEPPTRGLVMLDLAARTPDAAAASLADCARANPGARIACVIDERDDAVVETLVAAGAAGVLIKAAPPEALVAAMELLLAGHDCRPAPTFEIDRLDVPAAVRARLSAREQRMLRRIAGGESIGSVAKALHLTPARVVHDVRRILSTVRGEWSPRSRRDHPERHGPV